VRGGLHMIASPIAASDPFCGARTTPAASPGPVNEPGRACCVRSCQWYPSENEQECSCFQDDCKTDRVGHGTCLLNELKGERAPGSLVAVDS
jgi:hypothetical protein